MKRLTIGILPQDKMRERVIKIAKGDLKPKPGDPKVWFPSMRSLAEVLSDENRLLLKVIAAEQPPSIRELAERTGRKQSNLSRTLKTMSHYGLVELKPAGRRCLKPVAKATQFKIVA
ncbi:Predicted transcriptional regulator [Ectothiorhodosinus mongolicus]|uniref:Predicted transcriptional regulator n=1 Tax=Ectothiorhodosinus mongolicus TaxID=233100 RepID=A0A1R3VR70_9GAMM|nr:helix-turn-helix domain-containing protein [Ectothiorhodosinus mongolicus]ULX56766.1 transcriptional regulator [Ectothiorhodosinus mongolicus]SIT67179.1 Predicted transcriptional regulator [Ectothiorhodosinus mongolicus]